MLKKPERSSSIHEATPPKPDKILFRPLSEKAQTVASPDLSTVPKKASLLSSAEDLVDTNKTISEKWPPLFAEFPEMEKFDHKSIKNYGGEDEEALEKKCILACDFFGAIVKTLAMEAGSLTGKTIKDDLLKIYVVTFQKITYLLLALVISTSEEKEPATEQLQSLAELLKKRAVLNDFLLLIMQDRKNSSILSQHDNILMQIVRETVNQLHERLANSPKISNPANVAYFLYHHFQAVAMLAAFNEARSFMKTAAYDCIRLAFETLERSLRASFSSASLKEVYALPITGNESWMEGSQTHLKLAVQFRKKKLSFVQLRPGTATSPLFSLRYVNIYYVLKITQMMIARNIFAGEERTLDTIAIVLKDTSDLLNEVNNNRDISVPRIEIALNEDLVCFNIIKRVLPNVDDPLAILEKLGYTRLVKELVAAHLAVAFKLRLVAFPYAPGQPQREILAAEEEVSYKKVHDYVAGVFNFIGRLKSTKSSKALSKVTAKTSKASIGSLTEETLGEIIANVDTIVSVEPELLILKTYIVEQMFNHRSAVSRQTAEHLIRLIGSNAFHFTSPNSLKELETATSNTAEDELNRLNNRRIATLLNDIIAYDKTWAETILSHLMGQIKPLYGKEERLFGLYKLIYCALVNEVHDNVSFASKLLPKSQPTCPTHETRTENNNKAVLAFIEIKGISQLVEILQLTYRSMASPSDSDSVSTSTYMTEQLFLHLNNIPAISEQILLKSPKVAVEFLEFFFLGPHIQSVIVHFMQKLLSTVKHSGSRTQALLTADRAAYFPLRILDYVKDKSGEKQAKAVIPLLELIVNFVVPEANVKSLETHQTLLMGSSALDTFFRVLQANRNTTVAGVMLGLFLKFLFGLQYHNDAVSAEIGGTSLIGKKELYSFIKEAIRSKQLRPEEIEKVLGLLLEIVFETSVDLAQPAHLLIRLHHFLLIYLTLLAHLALDPTWKARVAVHCEYLLGALRGSYLNYSICTRERLFKKILKLMSRFRDIPSTLESLSELATRSACVNSSSYCLKLLISNLTVFGDPAIPPSCQQSHVMTILNSLLQILTDDSHREVFSFSGKPGCGIGLVAQKKLPEKGYCFCGWIRVERVDQSLAESGSKMTVFKLGASKNREIELFFKDGFLNYSMADIKTKEQAYVTTFGQKRIEEDRWYFVELYHLNNDGPKSLSLYLNTELVKESPCKPYPYKLDYDENTIGCGVQLEYVDKQGYEKIKNCFRGEMSALFFLEVTPKTLAPTHSSLAYLSSHVSMDEIFHSLSGQAVESHHASASNSKGPKTTKMDTTVLEKVVMQINPMYTGKLSQSKERLYAYCKTGSKTPIDVFNHVERLYPTARIDHNMPAKDFFLDVGGPKMLMPLLYRLADAEIEEGKGQTELREFVNNVAAKVVEILDCVIRLDHQRAAIFFESEDGLLILRYLFERIAKKFAGFSSTFYEKTLQLLGTLDENYPSLTEKYIEMLLLNGDMWGTSSTDIQLEIIDRVGGRGPLDAMLNAMEVYVNQDRDNTHVVRKLSIVITQTLKTGLTEENLNKLMGYANLYYIRRRPNYWLQLYNVLRIVLDLYMTHTEKFMKEVKAAVKAKKDSKVISTLAVILRHCLSAPSRKKEETPGIPEEDKCSDAKSQKCDDNVSEYPKSPEKEQIIDAVRAIALYIIGSIDWGIFADLVKEFAKEDSLISPIPVSQSKFPVPSPPAAVGGRGRLDVVGHLIKHLGKSGKTSESIVLDSFFSDFPGESSAGKMVGMKTYFALSALAFDTPEKLAASFGIVLPPPSGRRGKEERIIRSQQFYELLLRQAAKRFLPEACKELVNDLVGMWGKDARFSKEIFEAPALLRALFGLCHASEDPRLEKICAETICKLPPSMQELAWAHMRGSPAAQVRVLDESLSFALTALSSGAEKHIEKFAAKCTLYAYAIEDVLGQDCTVAKSKEFVQAAGKLLLLADMLDLMYVSLPAFAWMDERISSVPRWEERSPTDARHEVVSVQREGGLLRVLLKIVLVATKFDATGTAGTLLRYLVFREKSEKKTLKGLAGIKRKNAASGKAKSKHTVPPYNLIDIVLWKDPECLKQYTGISEFYLKKVIGNDISTLDTRKVHKSASEFPKDKNFFERPHTVFMYLFCEIFHLIHFDLFGITAYNSLPKSIGDMDSQKPTSNRFKLLHGILSDIVKSDRKSDLTSTVLGDFEKASEALKARLQSCLPERGAASLKDVWSVLDMEPGEDGTLPKKKEEHWDIPANAEELKAQIEGLESFRKKWPGFVKRLVGLLLKSPETALASCLGEAEVVGSIQPYLMLFTANRFSRLDKAVTDALSKYRPWMNREDSVEAIKFRHDLLIQVKEKFANISISKAKIERDELRQDFEVLAGTVYRRLEKEQTDLEVGAWFNKCREKEYRQLFGYVRGKYEKMVRRCPLHGYLKGAGLRMKNAFGQFVALGTGRDGMGRAMKLKRFAKMCDNPYVGYNFSYIRRFILKKFLVTSLMSAPQKSGLSQTEFFQRDLASDFTLKLFHHVEEAKDGLDSPIEHETLPSPTCSFPGDLASDATPPMNNMPDECVPKKVKAFESEMITIRGSVFGRLAVNSICLSFRSETRKVGPKYRLGSTAYNHAEERVNKKWPLESIKEVVVKRYNLVRQAVEIYFYNSKSVFFCLFDKHYLKSLLDGFSSILKKNPLLSMELVARPEAHFADKKYRDKWLAGDLSNFEYLMLLNKYSGRSFNHLGQYPIFPWVIRDYSSTVLPLHAEATYRPLDTTVAGISLGKKKLADEKLRVLLEDKTLPAYQFGSHYLPGRVVLGYMLRLEPYASLLMNFEQGHDAAARMFHVLKQAWATCETDNADNKELIPEFYYLPELFVNYNFYQYGSKEADDDLPKTSLKGKRIMVDQVVLPPWARNNHVFIQLNSLALESRIVSLNLDKWIDLIFGCRQQDPKFYNMYRELCDESATAPKIDQLTVSQITEVQEFGVNPMKMFTDKHLPKSDAVINNQSQYALFTEPLPKEERLFALIKVANFPNCAVNFIEAYEKRVVAVLSSQRVFRTKERYINVAHEKSVTFDKKEIALFPYKKLYRGTDRTYNCDIQRCFATVDTGNLILSCKHYDNSCKLTNCASGEVEHTLSFHKTMVNAVCATESKEYILTASNDGVVAAWLPKKLGFDRPVWSACDHKRGVVTIDACEKLDIVASGAMDGTISLRSVSSGKFLRIIRPELQLRGLGFEISHVRLSFRGYVVLLAKCRDRSKTGVNDYLMTFSINGEQICVEQTKEVVNTLLLDESGYQLVTGGRSGRILKHNILSLGEGTDLLESLDGEQPSIEDTLRELLDSNAVITAMELTKQGGCQQLLIGLSTGSVYTYKYSPRLIGSKIFETLQGIIQHKQ